MLFALKRLRWPIAVIVVVAFAALLAFAAFSSSASATHNWSKYHWARQSNPFTLKLIDNVTSTTTDPVKGTTGSDWDTMLQNAAGVGTYASDLKNDWSKQEETDPDLRYTDYSDPLDMVLDPDGTPVDPMTCSATSGKVRVCNAEYGENGWIGLATIWASRWHITQGTTKLNDSYFSYDSRYNDYWKLGTLCQEVGHTIGLDHQSEKPDVDKNTCMDYYNQPDEANTHPNKHDYEQLDTIYEIDNLRKTFGHADNTTTVAQRTPRQFSDIDTSDPGQWGRLSHTSANGKIELWERNFGGGHKMITRVIRAEERDKNTS
jgi:hypothetical protein